MLDKGIRTFLTVWAGQVVSMLGSGLTAFALIVWVYQKTGEVTDLALISLFLVLPAIFIAPFAGAVVDRYDRRWVMIAADTASALITLGVFLLLLQDRLAVWHAYLFTALGATFAAFQGPAWGATTTLLVPKKHYGRASGMMQFGQAAAQLFSPMLAGVLLVSIALKGIVFIDFATFFAALLALAVVRFPRPKATSVPAEKPKGRMQLLREAIEGWYYIRKRPGLFGLLVYFTITNFLAGMVTVLGAPLILAFTSPAVLGTLSSVAGVGMLAGTIVMSAWGGPKRRIVGVLSFQALIGLCIVLAGLKPSAVLFGIAGFGFLFCFPIVIGSSRAIWQSKVAPEIQGRVFSLVAMVSLSCRPVAFVLAGPLCDRVFEPLMAPGGALAPSLGAFIGTGPGRGVALLFIVLGICNLLATGLGYLYPRIRRVEDELDDAIPDTEDREPLEPARGKLEPEPRPAGAES